MAKGASRLVFSDRMIGGLLTLVFLIGYLADWDVLGRAENLAYDLRASWVAPSPPSDKVVIVGVDEESLAKVGKWPWPRTLIGQVVETLRQSGAKVIGLGLPLSEPDHTQGIEELRSIQQKLTAQAQALATVKELRAIRGKLAAPSGAGAAVPEATLRGRDVELRLLQDLYRTILRDLREAQARLDQDTKLAAVLAHSPRVLLPMQFQIGHPEGDAAAGPSPAILANAVDGIENPLDLSKFPVVEARIMMAPLPAFQREGLAVGHLMIQPDPDGVVRRDLLLLKHGEHHYPSFALRAAGAYLGVAPDAIRVRLGQHVSLGDIRIPTDRFMRMWVNFSRSAGTFKPVPAHQVLAGKIPPQTFRDKVVLVAPLAVSIQDRYATPVGTSVAGVEVVANVLQNILGGTFISVPPWARAVELGMFLAAGLFLVHGLPKLRVGLGGLVAGVLLVACLGGAAIAFVSSGYLIRVVPPVLLLLLGYGSVAGARLLATKTLVRPVDETGPGSTQEPLKKLRQLKRLRKAGEPTAARNGDPKQGGADSTVVLEKEGGRPTLGRYEIIEELGRGAMGVVYLGRDPTIHRSVAIKTIRLDEVESDQLAEVKERFFREAESAGRLSHPNIVTIYDAGEEHDLGYIAMEILDGVDLKDWCRTDNLMPLKRVMEIVAKVAEALDYAHAQGVVHRDIKPSNIMVMMDGSVKVTDFGIAKITASSKTQSGILLGTPSYMSPQQLAGAKVDGRSDVFSLGVVLFELLTGEKPFQADSVTALMFQIVNQPHPSPTKIRPDLPPEVDAIIDRALHKDLAQRYQRGLDMARDLRACMQTVAG